MQTSQLIQIIYLFGMVFACCAEYDRLRERLMCGHREKCEENCDECPYGSIISKGCEFEECLKGPGELCGGTLNRYGTCGKGLTCVCNYCYGCSTTRVEAPCFEPRNHIPSCLNRNNHKSSLWISNL